MSRPAETASADAAPLLACTRALGESEALAVGAVRNGVLIYASPALARLFSLGPGAQARVSDLVAPADRERVARALASPGEFALGFHGVRADGRLFEAQLTGCRAVLADGIAVAVAIQESGRDRDLRHITYADLFDAGTGLPNRRLLVDRLAQAIVAAGRGAHCVGIMAIGLSGDGAAELGPSAVREALLKEIGAKLRASLREADTLAFVGEGRFAALLPRLGARELAQTPAQRVLSALATPITLSDGVRRQVRCGVGIASYPDDAATAEALLARALAALTDAAGIAYAVPERRDAPRSPERISWSARYEVGIEVIDGQHRHLLALINRLGDELRGAREPDALIDGLRELLRYTEHHFATEERLMDEVGAGAERHRAEHRRLIDSLARQTLRPDPEGVSEGSRFLQDWLFRHIDEIDRPFAALLRTHGLK